MFSKRRSVTCYARSCLRRGAAFARRFSLPLRASGSSNSSPSLDSSSSPCLFSLIRKKNQKINPLFSNPYALLKKSVSVNSFTISSFRTLLQNTRAVHPARPKSDLGPSASSLLNSLESALAKNALMTPLQSALPNSLDLKSFRIHTYEKSRGRGLIVNQRCDEHRCPEEHRDEGSFRPLNDQRSTSRRKGCLCGA
jgi:hypothetical protein